MRNERMRMQLFSLSIAPECRFLGAKHGQPKLLLICANLLNAALDLAFGPRFDSQHRALHVVGLASTVQFEVLLDG